MIKLVNPLLTDITKDCKKFAFKTLNIDILHVCKLNTNVICVQGNISTLVFS